MFVLVFDSLRCLSVSLSIFFFKNKKKTIVAIKRKKGSKANEFVSLRTCPIGKRTRFLVYRRNHPTRQGIGHCTG